VVLSLTAGGFKDTRALWEIADYKSLKSLPLQRQEDKETGMTREGWAAAYVEQDIGGRLKRKGQGDMMSATIQ